MIVKSALPRSRQDAKARKRKTAVLVAAGCFVALTSAALAPLFVSHFMSTPAPSAQQCNSRFDQRTLAQVKAYASFEDCVKGRRAVEAYSDKDVGSCTSLKTKADLIITDATNKLLKCYREAALSGNVTPLSKMASLPSKQLAMSLLTTNVDQKSPRQTGNEILVHRTDVPGRRMIAVKRRAAHPGLAHLAAHLATASKSMGDTLIVDRLSGPSLDKMSVFAGVPDDPGSWLDANWPPGSTTQILPEEESGLFIADRINGAKPALPSKITILDPVVTGPDQVAIATQPNDAEIRLETAPIFEGATPPVTLNDAESVKVQPEPTESEPNTKSTAFNTQTQTQPTEPVKAVTPAQQPDAPKTRSAPVSIISSLSDDSAYSCAANFSIKDHFLQWVVSDNSAQLVAGDAARAIQPLRIANKKGLSAAEAGAPTLRRGIDGPVLTKS